MPTYQPTSTLDEDPADCPDCVAAGDICPWHAGWQAGWDQASAVVGALVLESGGGR